MDRVFDTLIAAAAADISRHGFAYLVVGGLWIVQKQGRRLHDLPGLAIAALRYICLAPGLLNRVVACRVKAFDRRDFTVDDVGNRGDAGSHGLLVHDDSACTAKRLTAAIFGTRQSDFVTEKPEQREIRVAIPVLFLAVDLHLDH